MLRLVSRSARRTELLGEAMGQEIHAGDSVLLYGAMGTGKTTLARGIARGAGCTVSARSPTFIIVAEYPGAPSIFHCDLYRLTSADEVRELGLDENLARGALVVEWPENAWGALPKDALHVELTQERPTTDLRRITLRAAGESASSALTRIATRLAPDLIEDDIELRSVARGNGKRVDRLIESSD